MFFLYLIFSDCLQKPIIFIPGLSGSSLLVTITNSELYPKCPKLVNYRIWPTDKKFERKYPECLAQIFLTVYNESSKSISHQPGIEITTDPIGHFEHLSAFQKFAQFLKSKGYTPEKDLFGFPYDWSLYYPGITDIFTKLKDFIEKIKSETGQKVVLMGHSMGTHVIRLFYTNYTTNEWIQDNVDSFVLLAPAIFGCFQPYLRAFQGKLWYLPETELTINTARCMSSYHVLMDNYFISGDHQIVMNLPNKPSEEGIKASEFLNYISENKLFDEEAIKIAKLIEPSLQDKPVQPPVRTFVIFNNQIDTPVALDASKNYSLIMGPGDGRCQDTGALYMCQNWLNTKCINLNSNHGKYAHKQMLYSSKVHKYTYNFINQMDFDPLLFSSSMFLTFSYCGMFVCFLVIMIMIVNKPKNLHCLRNYLNLG